MPLGSINSSEELVWLEETANVPFILFLPCDQSDVIGLNSS